jgi:exodeoxyribonuclease V gamma subunit
MLPPGILGKPVIDDVWPTVDAIHAAAGPLLGTAGATSAEVRTVLNDGRILSGTVPGVRGDVLATVLYARVAPKHRLAAWVRLLALTASDPGRPWSARTIGRRRDGGEGITVATIPALAADPGDRRTEALELLDELLDLHDRGLCEPLPLPCKTAARYASAVRAGADAGTASIRARKVWESAFARAGEDCEPEHVLAFGGERGWDDLYGERPRAGEHGGGWDAAQPSRLGRLALRLWTGPLDREEVRDRS